MNSPHMFSFMPQSCNLIISSTWLLFLAKRIPRKLSVSHFFRYTLHLTERAEWQYTQRELDSIEVFTTRTNRNNKITCMFIRCAPNARYTLLFSHGNAVDLGQMSSFYIGLGTRINCNVFSFDYSGTCNIDTIRDSLSLQGGAYRAAETSGPSTLVLSPTKKVCPTNLSSKICHFIEI